jgi:Lipocalin-like domain
MGASFTQPSASQLMRRLALPLCVLGLSIIGFLTCAVGADRDRNPLVGTWHLVSYIDTPEGSAPIQAYGTEPIGLFIFTSDGHVSISIMRNPPDITAATTDPDPEACIPGWYCAYFGTYTVNYERGIWVTHVLGGNIPAYLGTDQPRSFTINGDTLTISETHMEGNRRVRAERVLRRDTKTR